MEQLKAFLFVGGFTGLIMWLGLYLQTRNPNSEPTRFERIVANSYLWFRRLLCFGMALLFLLGGGIAVWASPNLWLGLAIGILVMIPVSALVWFGWFGHEGRSSSPQEDLQRYEAHKARYRWRW
jgi:hypothetical protein